MSMPVIKAKIEKVISDHMDDVVLDFLSDEAVDQVKLAVDSDTLVDKLMEALKEHVFRFDSAPYADQYCHTCQKMFGDFVSERGARVQADNLLKPDVIILLD